jgi:hypothetical protein
MSDYEMAGNGETYILSGGEAGYAMDRAVGWRRRSVFFS